MKIPHPIQYQGSKRKLASVILQYFPEQVARLVEPFAGTGAVSVACAAGGIAEKYWLNDYNRPLSELLRLIIDQPDDLSDFYETLWNQQHQNTLAHYYVVREEFNTTENPQLFLYLLARCVKGSVRYNSEGKFNQSPDKRRKGTKPATMRKNIFGVSSLLKNSSVVSCQHYTEMLAEITEQDLVYMDPPYQGVCKERDSRYYTGIDYTEFVDFLEQLNKKGTPYIISYDGKCGKKTYGKHLPDDLGLKRIELQAGRSSQATLLGKKDITYESLYLSESLLQITSTKPERSVKKRPYQRQINELKVYGTNYNI